MYTKYRNILHVLFFILSSQNYVLGSSSYAGRLWEEVANLHNGGGYSMVGKLYDAANFPTLMVQKVMDQVDNFAKHKARISQARYFLGDTFAERFDQYLKDSHFAETGVPSAVEVVDWIPGAKEITDNTSDYAVTNVLIPLQAKVLELGLPSPLSKIVIGLLTEERWLTSLRFFGTILANFMFPQGTLGMFIILVVNKAAQNPTMARRVFAELFHALKVFHRGAICMAANEMVSLEIPPYVLDEFVNQTKGELKRCSWPKQAISSMIDKIPMPMFLDYFAILIRQFPEHLSGPKSVVNSGIGWIYSRPSDIVMRLASVVGVFNDDNDITSSLNEMLHSILIDDGKRPIIDRATFLTLEYYIINLGIVDRLREAVDKGHGHGDGFPKRCQLITTIFLASRSIVEFVIKEGFYGLTALVMTFPPIGLLFDDPLKVQSILEFSIKHGTALSMLAVLQHANPLPDPVQLLRIKPKVNVNLDGSSRTKYFVFEAFINLRNDKLGGGNPLLCRQNLFPKVGTLHYMKKIPINLNFLPEWKYERLNQDEIRQTAIAIANIIFRVPIHVAVKVEKASITIPATINAILALQCGIANEPFLMAVKGNSTFIDQGLRKPLKEKLAPFKTKPSIINYQQG